MIPGPIPYGYHRMPLSQDVTRSAVSATERRDPTNEVVGANVAAGADSGRGAAVKHRYVITIERSDAPGIRVLTQRRWRDDAELAHSILVLDAREKLGLMKTRLPDSCMLPPDPRNGVLRTAIVGPLTIKLSLRNTSHGDISAPPRSDPAWLRVGSVIGGGAVLLGFLWSVFG